MIEQRTVYTEGEVSRINMARWDIERKIHYNMTHKFSYDFLLHYGYSKFLNRPEEIGEWKTDCDADDVGELFLRIYLKEYPDEYIKLHAEMQKWFEEHPKEGWIPKELYINYLKA